MVDEEIQKEFEEIENSKVPEKKVVKEDSEENEDSSEHKEEE